MSTPTGPSALCVEVYPIDGHDAFTCSRTTYTEQVSAPRPGDLVYAGTSPLYRVIDVVWAYSDERPTRVVVRVRLAYPERTRWWKRHPATKGSDHV